MERIGGELRIAILSASVEGKSVTECRVQGLQFNVWIQTWTQTLEWR